MVKCIASVKNLETLLGDFNGRAWGWGEFTRSHIQSALDRKDTCKLPWNITQKQCSRPDGDEWHTFHAARIAHFVINGIPDNDPYHISLGFRDGGLKIYEGRHRLAAAIVREDPEIVIRIDGDDKEIKSVYQSPLINPA